MNDSLALIDRQEAVIERERQERHGRAQRHPLITTEAAVGLLNLLELADQQFVLFLPGLEIGLK